jgi:hypothetical protein
MPWMWHLDPRDGFGVDRHEPSGRKSRCRVCHRRDANVYHQAVRKPRRLALLEAERAAEMKVLEREHRGRLKAVHKEAAEGARRQKALLAELGVPDLSPRGPDATPIDDDRLSACANSSSNERGPSEIGPLDCD